MAHEILRAIVGLSLNIFPNSILVATRYSPDLASPESERPLPIRGLWPILAEFIGVVFACELFVPKSLANTGSRNTEAGHSVDGVNGQAKAVGLVTNGQLQRRVDVALLLVASHVDVVLAGPT